jgi:hypothetical protein
MTESRGQVPVRNCSTSLSSFCRPGPCAAYTLCATVTAQKRAVAFNLLFPPPAVQVTGTVIHGRSPVLFTVLVYIQQKSGDVQLLAADRPVGKQLSERCFCFMQLSTTA